MWIDALDDFAIELENEPQDAMRGRMLRAKIDREIADRTVVHVKSVVRRSSLRVSPWPSHRPAKHSQCLPMAKGNGKMRNSWAS